MKGTVTWWSGRAFVAESGSGHAVVMDGPPDGGGRNIGVRPMEMLLTGKATTPFMCFGDRVRIEMLDAEGRSIFGAIDQKVRAPA